MRRSLHLLLVGLAVVLAACGLLPTATSLPPTPTVTPSPSVTPTTVWFPPTNTPTRFVPTPAEPTPDLHPALGELLLEDDFRDQSAWTTQRSEYGSVAFGKNELTIAFPRLENRFTLNSLRSGTIVDDFYLEMTITPSLCIGDNSYGILFRAQSETQYYRFQISCAGKLRLERVVGSEITVLQDWLLTGSVPPNAPATLRVGIWAVKREMRFFIDDVYQFSAYDPIFYTGQIGVFARSFGQTSLTVNFSALKIYVVRGFIPTAAVTPTVSPTATRAPRTTP
jgi:hypothetical protein